VPVDLDHRGKHGAPGHYFESFSRVPQIRVGDSGAGVVQGADRQESQPLRFDEFLK
jgi:hypothetical protein